MNHSYFLASHKIYATYTSLWVASVNLGKSFGTLSPSILRVEIVFWKKMLPSPRALFNLLKRKHVVFVAYTINIQDTAGIKISLSKTKLGTDKIISKSSLTAFESNRSCVMKGWIQLFCEAFTTWRKLAGLRIEGGVNPIYSYCSIHRPTKAGRSHPTSPF